MDCVAGTVVGMRGRRKCRMMKKKRRRGMWDGRAKMRGLPMLAHRHRYHHHLVVDSK